MNLKIRFALVISGLIVLLVGGLGGVLYWTERGHLLNLSEASRMDAVGKFAQVCEDSLLAKDEILLINYMKEVKRAPDVLWAMLIDSRGKILSHSNLSLRHKLLADEASRKASSSGLPFRQAYFSNERLKILEYAVPIRIGKQRIATARIGYDARQIESRMKKTLRQTLRHFLAVTFFALLFGIMAAFYVAETLVRPIRVLSGQAKQIGEGNFKVRIAASTRDEIGQLSERFNWMAQKLAELDEMKDQFIAAVSHDLRNPLSAIIMNTNFLLDSDLTREQERSQIGMICASAQRLTQMVSNILDTAKMKAGKLQYRMKPFDPALLIDEVCKLYRIQASNNKVTLTSSLPPHLPWVHGDENIIHRVFNNLLSNAIKFTRSGGQVTIGAEYSAPSPTIQFSVADTGIGILEKDIPQLFQRFSSVSEVDLRIKKGQGTGLGLSIAKMIVEDHGGRIWVESKRGKGTTFYWTLPAAKPSEPQVSLAPKPKHTKSTISVPEK